MSLNQPIRDLEKAKNIPEGTAYVATMGDGSGTKAVTQETLAEETGKALKVGNLEKLQTENKSSLVAAINEAAQSGSGGAAVDILDSKEEIEANTEPEKVAGALALKEMVSELNDNIAAITDGGTITGMNAREDGVYITYVPTAGADPVTKKLGSGGTIKCFNASSVSGDQSGSYPFSFNLSSVCENYQTLTANDIIGGIASVSTKTTSALIRSGNASFGKITSYDPKTGIINATVSIGSQSGNVSVTIVPCFYICG